MVRTTILLPRDLKRAAEGRARAKGLSLGELIRQELARATADTGRGRASDSVFIGFEVWRGDAPSNLALEHDAYLYDEAPHKPRRG